VQPANQILQQSKQSLQAAKDQFLKELNRRDPLWAEKIRQRKEQEIQTMNLAKQRIQSKILEREKQLRADEEQNLQLANLKNQVEAERERLAELFRQGQLRELTQTKELSFQQRELHRVQ